MYKDAYDEIDNIENIDEKVKELRNLADKIKKEGGPSAWYNFIRGLTLFYEGDKEKAITTTENAFLEEKNVIFCDKLIFMYKKLKDTEKVNEWSKRRDNLKLFEREEVDLNAIEKEQQELKNQLKKHDENRITLAIQYIQNNKKKVNDLSCLKILKRWSSSTPLLSLGIGKNLGNGGGLFVKWMNKGIVIDPGINFIQNMAERGLSVLDIDYVIVTHDHIDHNRDLLSIMDIKYQCIMAARMMPDLSDVEKKWITRDINYYIDEATAQHFQKDIRENNCKVNEFKKQMNIGNIESINIDSYINLLYFSTSHIINQVTYGIVLQLVDDANKMKQIGYTSDTRYFPELCDYFKDADYIIANLSEINLNDLEKKEYKKNHLGYQGCYDLITSSKIYCKYFILSEFWGGRGDIRSIITDYLKNECLKKKKIIKILPGDLNLSFDLMDDMVECNKCGKYYAENYIDIICDDNNIEYLCAKCLGEKKH